MSLLIDYPHHIVSVQLSVLLMYGLGTLFPEIGHLWGAVTWLIATGAISAGVEWTAHAIQRRRQGGVTR